MFLFGKKKKQEEIKPAFEEICAYIPERKFSQAKLKKYCSETFEVGWKFKKDGRYSIEFDDELAGYIPAYDGLISKLFEKSTRVYGSIEEFDSSYDDGCFYSEMLYFVFPAEQRVGSPTEKEYAITGAGKHQEVMGIMCNASDSLRILTLNEQSACVFDDVEIGTVSKKDLAAISEDIDSGLIPVVDILRKNTGAGFSSQYSYKIRMYENVVQLEAKA